MLKLFMFAFNRLKKHIKIDVSLIRFKIVEKPDIVLFQKKIELKDDLVLFVTVYLSL